MAPPAIDGVLAVAGTIATIIMIRDITRPRCGAVDVNGGTECTWESADRPPLDRRDRGRQHRGRRRDLQGFHL